MTAVADAGPASRDRLQIAARRAWRRLEIYAAPAVVLLAIVVPFLRFHEYGLLLPESIILMAGAAALGAMIGAASLPRPVLQYGFVAVTICVYVFYRPEVTTRVILEAFAIERVTGNLGLALTLIMIPGFLLGYLICRLLRRHLHMIVVAVFGTIVVTTIALPTAKGGEAIVSGALPTHLNDLPPVIHIILDEHIGIAGLPPELGASAVARRAIRTTYSDFTVYDRAYSQFAETKYSLSSLMNGDLGAESAELLDGDMSRFTLHSNGWFDLLEKQGYAIHVYQSAVLDMCGDSPAVDVCYTFPLFSPNTVQRTRLPTKARLGILARGMLSPGGAYQTAPLASADVLERLRSDIEQAPRGVAYIVHVLLPHHDYTYRENCSIADPAQWQREPWDNDGLLTRDQRALLYGRYLGQLICTESRMGALFAHLKMLGIYDDATIIVHGDHGSRIGERPYIVPSPQVLTDQDVIDHFATLLAIKAPAMAPGIRREPVLLQRVFAEAFLGGSRNAGATRARC